ncbi:DUF2490 domain-containing protein [Limnovirga soli]|uniref:DUF2490 domain-containing protein n=1 Tax=Limnovirga soli TaxID=2656915 RepID=A0A8J8FDT5_9BACT|nr:DUF2490 domain-containing protein [Limnovirga soli]NNV56231.1 DUF2490 domain-containing protein [Limnovirga soli]
MTFKYNKGYYFLILLFLGNTVFAQTTKEDPVDWQGWYGASLDADLPNKWAASLEYQARYFNNLQTYNGSYISLGGSKKVAEYLKILGQYRISFVQNGTYQRFTIGAEASTKINAFELSGRALLQNSVQDFDDNTKATDQSTSWRVRAQTKYRISKGLSAYASVEPIMQFGGRHFVDNLRNTVGLKAKIAKNTKLDVYYILRADYAKKYNRTFNIIGVDFNYTLKFKNQKANSK